LWHLDDFQFIVLAMFFQFELWAIDIYIHINTSIATMIELSSRTG
jgi:hypothetical protein